MFLQFSVLCKEQFWQGILRSKIFVYLYSAKYLYICFRQKYIFIFGEYIFLDLIKFDEPLTSYMITKIYFIINNLCFSFFENEPRFLNSAKTSESQCFSHLESSVIISCSYLKFHKNESSKYGNDKFYYKPLALTSYLYARAHNLHTRVCDLPQEILCHGRGRYIIECSPT